MFINFDAKSITVITGFCRKKRLLDIVRFSLGMQRSGTSFLLAVSAL